MFAVFPQEAERNLTNKSKKKHSYNKQALKTTPLKTNMSPENQWLEDVFPTEIVPVSGRCQFSGVYSSSFQSPRRRPNQSGSSPPFFCIGTFSMLRQMPVPVSRSPGGGWHHWHHGE